jgi:signal transduction histidine kinase
LKEKKSLTFESEHSTKAGNLLMTEVTANYIQFDGEEYNCAIMRDITGRKRQAAEQTQLQERVYQNQKYEALGTLAGGVAHDFNNILTAVINFAALARDDSPPSHPQIREYLGEVL